jgi:hypothetical protein
MDKFNKLPTGWKIVIAVVVIGIIGGTIFGVPVNENL